MASNPQWRGSIATWRARIDKWLNTSNPQALLWSTFSSICARCMADVSLANELWRSAFDAAQGNVAFAKLLAEAAGEVEFGIHVSG